MEGTLQNTFPACLDRLVGYDQRHMVTPGSQVNGMLLLKFNQNILSPKKTKVLAIRWFWNIVLSLHPRSYCLPNPGSTLVKIRLLSITVGLICLFLTPLNTVKVGDNLRLRAQMLSNNNNHNKQQS